MGLMQNDGADFTNSFRALGTDTAQDQFTNREAFENWRAKWQDRIQDEPDPQAMMQTANPAIIPRIHRIEQMIEAAVAGDMAPFERIMTALATPYVETDADLSRAPSALVSTKPICPSPSRCGFSRSHLPASLLVMEA